MAVFAALLAGVACPTAMGAGLTVANVHAAQRVGTKMVDITYNITGTTSPSTVSVRISQDNGKTFTVPSSTSLSGDFGAGIAPGLNKSITWNAGLAWNDQFSTTMRFEVTATSTPPPPTPAPTPGPTPGPTPAPSGMVLIPTGGFLMGDTKGDGGGDELPVHTVYLSAFYIDKYEVTKAQWDGVYTWALAHGYGFDNAGSGKAFNHPVQTVDWYDCVKWCNARSENEGLVACYTVGGATYKTGQSGSVVCNWSASGYRLPTEAEWEKAARGGLVGKRFPWGNTISQSQANYYAFTGLGGYDLGPIGWNPKYATGNYPYTSPVGSFAANGYGLYDMAGNVSEWCNDWYGNYGSESLSDPTGPTVGAARVVRGGVWRYDSNDCRVSTRVQPIPSYSTDWLGFRCVRR